MGCSRRLCPLVVVIALAAALPAPVRAGQIDLVSWADPTVPSNTVGAFLWPANPASADGRYVVFTSDATNVVSGQIDLNETTDAFVFDRVTGTRTLVSRRSGSALTTANDASNGVAISGDGRYVLFVSMGTNLVAGQEDTNGDFDLFLHDRVQGTTALVTHAAGSPATAADRFVTSAVLSADGSRVAFVSTGDDLVSGFQPSGYENVFLWDRASGTNTLVSHAAGSPATAADNESGLPFLSGDGRYVAFQSRAGNIVAGQVDAGQSRDVFLYDHVTGTSTLVSRTSASPLTTGGGSVPLDLSRDGRYVLFTSNSTHLVAGQQDSSNHSDIFQFDRLTGTTLLVSRAAGTTTTAGDHSSFDGTMSGDGRYVAFTSWARNLVPGTYSQAHNVFFFDRDAGTTVLVSHAAGSSTTDGNGYSQLPAISLAGDYVVFLSEASDLVPGDTNGVKDAFLYDRAAAQVRRIAPAFDQERPEISDDGSSVVFDSTASDLVTGDLNSTWDVFLWRHTPEAFAAVSAHGPGMGSVTPLGNSVPHGVSADGRYVVFVSDAPNLALPAPQADTNGKGDVFLRDRLTGTTVLVSHVPGSPTTAANGESFVPVMSADGNVVVFLSLATNLVAGPTPATPRLQVFAYDRTTEEVSLVSHAAGSPTQPASDHADNAVVSHDGRYIAFTSRAVDLVAGQSDTQNVPDVFLRDRVTGETVLVSHASGSTTMAVGGAFPVLDAQGRYVAFYSLANNLVAGQNDANNTADAFLYDRVTGTSRLISHVPASLTTTGTGGSSPSSISADGGFIAFTSSSTDLAAGVTDTNDEPDVFLYETATGAVSLVSRADDPPARTASHISQDPVLSADGRWLTFVSKAVDLIPEVPNDGWYRYHRILFDRLTGALSLVSRHDTFQPSPAVISGDGGTLAFYGFLDDLESEGEGGLLLYDRITGGRRLVSPWNVGSALPWPTDEGRLALDADGSVLAFSSTVPNLVPGDFNQRWDAFAFDRSGGTGAMSFFTLLPCRVMDSRQPQDGPAFASGSPRVVDVLGLCGIPATARALSVNVTVTQAPGVGHLTIGPGDLPLPATSTLNFAPGKTRANNAILPLPVNGLGTLKIAPLIDGGGTVHVLIDVNGYFE